MSTTTLVFVAIWNAVLLSAFVIVLLRRKRLLSWVTGADAEDRSAWERRDEWDEFLAEHPELTDDGVRAREARKSGRRTRARTSP